jgi:lipopolysaccharide export system protein LptA
MKKILITFSVLLILLSGFSTFAANAFFKHSKKNVGAPKEETALKASAAYLELEGDKVEYDQEKNVYTTTGMSTAHIIDQNAKLEADEIIYYGATEEVLAMGNVTITRDGIVTTGQDFRFDVTSSKYLLTNPNTVVKGAVIKARTATSDVNNNIEYQKGTFKFDEPIRIAQGFGARRNPPSFYSRRRARASKAKASWESLPAKERYRVTAEKIVYDTNKKIRNLTIYGGKLHFKHFSLPAQPKFTTTLSSDPNVRSAPLIAPVIGTQGVLGGFAVGPNFNLNVTDYHILSIAPFAQIGSRGDNYGFGGRVGFHGPKSSIEAAYGSLKNRYILKAVQTVGTKTQIRLAHNQYLDDGFIGSTLTKYIAEVVDRRRAKFPFTESGLNFRSSLGWIQTDPGLAPTRYQNFLEDAADRQKFKKSAFKFQEQLNVISKPVIKFGNAKYNTALRLRTRNAFRAYSTGDVQGVITGGPLLDNTVGPLSFEVGYVQGWTKGKSPLLYDQYIQGMQSIALDGDLRIFEGLTIGGYGTYNMKEGDVIEKQIRAKIGPKDFKMLVNWDALRQQTQFGLNFLFGQPVDFEKFVILNTKAKSGGI